MSHEAPDVTGGFLARGRLAGAQQHRHRPAGGSVVDVDRQEAAFAVVAIPKGELLVAVDHVAGVIDVERHRLGFGRIAVAVDGNHRAHQPCQLPCGRGVLPPAHRRLTGETWSRPRQLAQRQAEAGIIAQGVEVIGILVAAGDRKDPRAQDVIKRMDHPGGIAPISDAGSKPFANPYLSLGLRQQQHPAVRSQPAAVKRDGHLFATHRWKAKDRHAIVNGGGSSLWHFAPRCRI